MLRNCTSCYRICPNRGFYFEMRNRTTFYIFFTIEYRLGDKTVTHQSPVFAPGKKSHLLFPSDTPNITFIVFNASNNPPNIISLLTVLAHESICYDVTGNTVFVQCVRVPC